jgi:hypothetical protein
MSDQQFGGRITFEFAGKIISIANASVKLDIFGASAEAMANQDATVCYKYTPKPKGADFTLRDGLDIDWPSLMRQQGNCTIVEEENNVSHLFTACRLVGEPIIDRDNGEVTGVSVKGGQYSRVLG